MHARVIVMEPIGNGRKLLVRFEAPSGNRVWSFTLSATKGRSRPVRAGALPRSEEHTSELQSRSDIVCRLLLEKKKKAHFNQSLWTADRLDDSKGTRTL